MLKSVRHGAISVAATLFFGAIASPVLAQAPATHRFDVSSQPLGRALNELAAQAGINIYFSPPDVQGKQSPPLKADVSTDDALTQLLAGSRLTFRHLDEQTITIVPAGVPAPADLEEVQVTGSRLQTESAEGAHPVREITRQEIQRSGRTTLQGFLTTLPEVSVFEGPDGHRQRQRAVHAQSARAARRQHAGAAEWPAAADRWRIEERLFRPQPDPGVGDRAHRHSRRGLFRDLWQRRAGGCGQCHPARPDSGSGDRCAVQLGQRARSGDGQRCRG
ncbi:MAG: secretin and TonB N-terminal domain-containing protein [Gammaproteobacteria bacterium]